MGGGRAYLWNLKAFLCIKLGEREGGGNLDMQIQGGVVKGGFQKARTVYCKVRFFLFYVV